MTSLLQQQMTRYYDYMKPRYTNPTYSSFNVGSSLAVPATTFHHESPSRTFQPSSNQKIQQMPIEKPIQRSPKIQGSREMMGESRRSRSQLSHYGTNSLNRVSKHLNQRDIFEKQEKRYNIITILPKEHNETIKKYPKYHLQNLDQNYFKKMQLQGEYESFRNSRYQQQTN